MGIDGLNFVVEVQEGLSVQFSRKSPCNETEIKTIAFSGRDPE